MRYVLVLILTMGFTTALFSQVTNSNNNCPCDYPTLSFKGDEVVLNNDIKSMLAKSAIKLK